MSILFVELMVLWKKKKKIIMKKKKRNNKSKLIFSTENIIDSKLESNEYLRYKLILDYYFHRLTFNYPWMISVQLSEWKTIANKFILYWSALQCFKSSHRAWIHAQKTRIVHFILFSSWREKEKKNVKNFPKKKKWNEKFV